MAKKIEENAIPSKGEIILYQSPDGEIALDVRHIYRCGPDENNDLSDE